MEVLTLIFNILHLILILLLVLKCFQLVSRHNYLNPIPATIAITPIVRNTPFQMYFVVRDYDPK